MHKIFLPSLSRYRRGLILLFILLGLAGTSFLLRSEDSGTGPDNIPDEIGTGGTSETQKSYQVQLLAYFSPEGQARDAVVEEIRRAKKSISIAMYVFSDTVLANTLLKAKERGVDIKIVLDRENSGDENSKRDWLEEKGIALRYYTPEVKDKKNEPGKMHHKFAVIDGYVVMTGSFNWTYSAEKYNNENLLVIYDRELARAYLAQWQTLWDKGIAYQELLKSKK